MMAIPQRGKTISLISLWDATRSSLIDLKPFQKYQSSGVRLPQVETGMESIHFLPNHCQPMLHDD